MIKVLTEPFSASNVQNQSVLEIELDNAKGMRNVEWVNWSKYTFVIMTPNQRVYVILPPYSFGSKNSEFKTGTQISNQLIQVESTSPGANDYLRLDFHDKERPEYLQTTTKTM